MSYITLIYAALSALVRWLHSGQRRVSKGGDGLWLDFPSLIGRSQRVRADPTPIQSPKLAYNSACNRCD